VVRARGVGVSVVAELGLEAAPKSEATTRAFEAGPSSPKALAPFLRLGRRDETRVDATANGGSVGAHCATAVFTARIPRLSCRLEFKVGLCFLGYLLFLIPRAIVD
jgi:hypothetical protein